MAEEQTRADGGGEEPAQAPDSGEAQATGEEKVGGQERPPRPTGAYFLSTLALLAGLGALGGGGYLYWQWDARWATLEGRLGAQDDRLARLQGRLESQDEALDEARQGLAERVDELRGQLEEVQGRTADLQQRLEGGRRYWLLERVEGLLRTADRLARLEGDPRSARAALDAADTALRQLGDPDWLTVRQAIQDGMTDLEQAPRPDTPGIVLKLSSLTRTALDLPLRGTVPQDPEPPTGGDTGEEPEEAAPEGFWGHVRAAADRFWSDLKGLVRLRRAESPAEPLLPPKEAHFLRHNLVLALQSARLAALRGDTEVYEQSLADARDWLGRFFAEDHEAVRGMDQTLADLADRRVARAFPDLDQPLERFLKLREEQRR